MDESDRIVAVADWQLTSSAMGTLSCGIQAESFVCVTYRSCYPTESARINNHLLPSCLYPQVKPQSTLTLNKYPDYPAAKLRRLFCCDLLCDSAAATHLLRHGVANNYFDRPSRDVDTGNFRVVVAFYVCVCAFVAAA